MMGFLLSGATAAEPRVVVQERRVRRHGGDGINDVPAWRT
jgi:hypothetical protein